MEPMKRFVRPMLNAPASERLTGQIFVAQKLARLDAAHEANKIWVEYMNDRATPIQRGEVYSDLLRLLEIWQSLRARYGGV
jgi:hypothetical protein